MDKPQSTNPEIEVLPDVAVPDGVAVTHQMRADEHRPPPPTEQEPPPRQEKMAVAEAVNREAQPEDGAPV